MRNILFILSIVLVINGCKKDTNPVESTTQPTLSVSTVIDSLQYMLTIPKAVFGIHDTLKASLTALNLRAAPETLLVNIGNMPWTLKNDNGEVIMYGPRVISKYIITEVITSHQSTLIGAMGQPIADSSGNPVQVGSYVLSAGSFSNLSLSLSIQ